MSSSTKTDLVLSLDSRLNVSAESTALVEISGVNNNLNQYPADGSSFPSQITFSNVVLPSLSASLLNREIRVRYFVQVAYVSNGAGVAPTLKMPQTYYDPSYQVNAALRLFPLQSCIDTLNLQINSASTTINSRQVISALQRTLTKEYLAKQASEMPSMNDQRAVLLPSQAQFTGWWVQGAAYPAAGAVPVAFSNGMTGTWTSTGAAPADGTLVPVTIAQLPNVKAYFISSTAAVVQHTIVPVYVDQDTVVDQPLSKYEGSYGTTRGSFKAIRYQNNIAGGGQSGLPAGQWDIFTYEVSEPLLISPLTLHEREVALGNINVLSIIANFSNLKDMICTSGCIAGLYDPANLNVQIVATPAVPQLQIQVFQVDPNVVQIPRAITYDFESVVYFPKTLATNVDLTADNYTQIFQSDLIRFSSLPKRIFVFGRVAMSQRLQNAGAYPDVFLGMGDPLSGLGQTSIQIDTRSGLLAAASTKQLWKASTEAGLEMSWERFQYGDGAVLCIDPVKLLGVNVEQGMPLPGMSQNVNFQIQVCLNNANFAYAGATQAARAALGVPAAAQIELMIVAVYAGSATIMPDSFMQNLGELTASEVGGLIAAAPKDGAMVSSEMVQPTVKGAGLFGTLKTMLGKTARGIGHVIEHPIFKAGLAHASKLSGGRMHK
jgi:hypothetical protein